MKFYEPEHRGMTAVLETRSRDRHLLMDGGATSSVRELEKRQR